MQSILNRAKAIKLMIFDVDGVLTTGTLVYGKEAIDCKEFHVHDGLGIKMLRKSGIEIAIITTCKSEIIKRRALDLGIDHLYQGFDDKMIPFEQLKAKTGMRDDQIGYMGDDLPDIPVIRRVGLGIAVANAANAVKQQAVHTSTASGGQGAVREICEMIMQAQGTYATLLETYTQR